MTEGSAQDHRATGPEGFYFRWLLSAPGNGWPSRRGQDAQPWGQTGEWSDSLRLPMWGWGCQWGPGQAVSSHGSWGSRGTVTGVTLELALTVR